MKTIINKMIAYQLENGNMHESEKDIYIYAYTVLIEECINVAIAILVGFIFKELKLVICFLCAYIPLRRLSGGYHAEDWKTCSIVSTVLIIVICMIFNMDVQISIYTKFIILIFFQLCIVYLTPVDSINKRLSKNEKKEYHKKVYKILLFQIIILIFAILTHIRYLYMGIYYSHIVLSSMLIIGFYKNYRVRRKSN